MDVITRWDPVKEMEDLQNRLSNFFGRRPARLGDAKEESITVAEWAPLVDITEDDKEYIIKTELPEEGGRKGRGRKPPAKLSLANAS